MPDQTRPLDLEPVKAKLREAAALREQLREATESRDRTGRTAGALVNQRHTGVLLALGLAVPDLVAEVESLRAELGSRTRAADGAVTSLTAVHYDALHLLAGFNPDTTPTEETTNG